MRLQIYKSKLGIRKELSIIRIGVEGSDVKGGRFAKRTIHASQLVTTTLSIIRGLAVAENKCIFVRLRVGSPSTRPFHLFASSPARSGGKL